jgi:methylmalonyl-CoA mutase N-terminal domain/subunit
MEYIKKIDELGGAAKAIERGYIQQEIQDSAYNYQKEIEAGERIIVGMNKFQINESAPKGLLKVDPIVGELQKKKLAELRRERDNEKVNAALEALRNAAKGDDNLMPLILDAVKTYATLGEICGVLREVFGEYQQSIIL